jgi:hypothetical protein
VIGGALPATAVAGLRKRGCHVDVALDFAAAVRRMRRDRYDVVVTWPHVEGDADGLRFVRAFKQVAAAPPANTDARLLEQYARVPFLILPLDGTTEFALFASAKRWFLGDTNEVPLHRAILDACAFD